MRNCPKCSNKLPFFKIGFLSKRKNTIECPKCNAYLIGDKHYLSSNGAKSGGISGSLACLTVYSIRDGTLMWIISLPAIIIVLFIFAKIQAKDVPLKIGVKPEEKEKIENYIKPPNKENRVEYLKYKYRKKSIKDLEHIVSSAGHVEDAKNAANELIKERLHKDA